MWLEVTHATGRATKVYRNLTWYKRYGYNKSRSVRLTPIGKLRRNRRRKVDEVYPIGFYLKTPQELKSPSLQDSFNAGGLYEQAFTFGSVSYPASG